jgi:hypothetical protein
MQTIKAAHSYSACYLGERGDWLILATVTRDSGALDRSNWQVISGDMDKRFGDSVAVERSSHWACGWVDYLIIDPADGEAVKAAQGWLDTLASYPVADDEHFMQLEHDEAMEYCSQVPYADGLRYLVLDMGYDESSARMVLADLGVETD